jgi:uncharacterized membrane protein
MASDDKKNNWHSILSSRPHLMASIALGIVTWFLLPNALDLMTRALTVWNVAVWSFLGMMLRVVITSSHHDVRKLADKEDEHAGVVMVVLLLASIVSLTAIFYELGKLPDAEGLEAVGGYVLTVATLFGSWLLVGTLFCFHYAHKYYQSDAEKPPLQFPDDEKEPDYWDFMYFSFTISVAVQTADIDVMTNGMRKLVLGHSVLNFFFNLVIIGLSINIAAALIE